MNKNLKFLETRAFNKSNIDEAITDYRDSLSNVPLSIYADDILSFLTKIKREEMKSGPYPNVSLFEAANRIMTDLTILYGIRDLLNGKVLELDFLEYNVEFGNENKNKHDITANKDGKELIGEAFNVSKTFFHTKKSSSLKKLNASMDKSKILLLLYNDDAHLSQSEYKINDNEFHYRVKIIL
jgi:hypothetical protein